ncbi:hypothetical protein BDR03DRAFT_997757 [Suillus americanus]|nr:hypothetical protein BDR03DRAFT_997757 [Suillus americanus]
MDETKITERSGVEYGPLKLNIASKVIIGNLVMFCERNQCSEWRRETQHNSYLLHFGSSHPVLVTTLTSFLVKFADARVNIPAGKYTSQTLALRNLELDAGIGWVECTEASDDTHRRTFAKAC